jgi:hypothetical protein
VKETFESDADRIDGVGFLMPFFSLKVSQIVCFGSIRTCGRICLVSGTAVYET